jgi:hypothetical protein
MTRFVICTRLMVMVPAPLRATPRHSAPLRAMNGAGTITVSLTPTLFPRGEGDLERLRRDFLATEFSHGATASPHNPARPRPRP